MSAHFTALALIATALVALPACEKKETPTSAPASSAAVPSTGSLAAASAQPSDDGEGMPMEEDFEDEAEQKITAQNVNDELDKLEKEIAE
ncbi:MAG: hypothetical protein IPI67_22125 [Myxococcales bacterium]|nr:hypothetical protein [Myxococcales bacterium]